ncbi:hypothetical protein [Mycolicibacterium sp. P1-5]|uniref:aa3-type cytochrome oxidase subunit CtaJ n=1 Tax=Mycolicibacterium sp. P1-5 TaxID=2024617 RepID=UPI0011ECF948|nr:hypothetical protein [Mycolicibacterium sp. P1-5]KAA0103733.1 hypothetical protein CIW47_22085 [Mycolicibacterium sp. P1-5]
MNGAVVHLVLVGVPLALVIVLSLLIFPRPGKHPKTYKLSEKWTHAPILWASDEVVPGGGHHGHGAHEVNVGGGASGKW